MFQNELRIAIEAVSKAALLTRKIQSELLSSRGALSRMTLTKSDASPVTVADFSAQAVVLQHLEKHFPQDPVVAEEDSQDLLENPELALSVLKYVG